METKKKWLQHYDPGIPWTLTPYPQQTLLDVFAEAVRLRPDHPALLFQGRVISNLELDQHSSAFAAALTQRGLKKNDRVALLLPNTPQLMIALFGTWKAGGIAVPLNPLYTAPELEHALCTCAAEIVVVLTPFYDKVKALQPHIPLKKVIAANIKEYLPRVKQVLFTLLKEKKDGHAVKLQAGDEWLPEILKPFIGKMLTLEKPLPDSPAVLLFSGGTTGFPKGALGTHQALLISGIQIHTWVQQLLVDWQDVIVLNMPLFHAYGLAGVLTAGLVGHNPFLLIPNPRDLDDMLAQFQKTRPAFLPGVPTLYNALLKHPKVQAGKVDLSSIKLCISGAAPLMAETKQRFENLTGCRMVEAYALTESMLACTMSPVAGVYKPGSIGIPLPDVEIRILDQETGVVSSTPGRMGEILMAAPQLMRGYWGNPGETANMLRDGWLHTGDIGYQDEDGYVYVVDRLKDLIKPSGFQVWPREVEEVIASHPAVLEVCVAGIPDAYTGEAVKAWVVLRLGEHLLPEQLQVFCRERLAAYKIPKQIEICCSLPKSTVGKILRRELVKGEV